LLSGKYQRRDSHPVEECNSFVATGAEIPEDPNPPEGEVDNIPKGQSMTEPDIQSTAAVPMGARDKEF